jgi:hypothetical protein
VQLYLRRQLIQMGEAGREAAPMQPILMEAGSQQSAR